jgi:hypothetical protein
MQTIVAGQAVTHTTGQPMEPFTITIASPPDLSVLLAAIEAHDAQPCDHCGHREDRHYHPDPMKSCQDCECQQYECDWDVTAGMGPDVWPILAAARALVGRRPRGDGQA